MAANWASTEEKKKDRLAWIVLVLLVAVALVLRWRYIREISLFVDEFVTAWAAQNVLERGLPLFPSGNIYPHGLLFTYLEAPFLLAGFDETLVRIPGLLISLIAVPVVYWAGRRLFSPTVGLVAAAAMAVDPDLIVWGGRARMYALLQLLVTLAVVVYYRGLAADRARDRYLAMGLLVAAVFTHLEAALLLPTLALATLVAWPWRRLLRRDVVLPFVLGGLGAVAFYLLAKYGQPNHLQTLEQEGRAYVDLTADLMRGPLAFAPVFVAPHRLAFSLLAVAGLVFFFRPRFERGSPLAYCTAVLVGLLIPLMTLAGDEWQRERYLFLALPLLFLLGAEALSRLVGLLPLAPRVRRWLPVGLALLVVLYVGLLGSARAYVQEWGYDLAFRWLQEEWQPEAGDRLATSMTTAALLYLGHNDAFVIQHGYEEYVVNRPADGLAADLWTATPVVTTTAGFAGLLQEAERLWFVTDGWRFQTRYQPDWILYVLEQMDLVYNERGVLIFRGEDESLLPGPAFERQRTAPFEDDLALTGFGLSTTSLVPGEELEVTLHWQALPGAGPAYTTFLHLVTADGRGVAGVDEPVLGGLYQPDLWPRDRSLPDRHRLLIPADLPAGRYRLDLGLYRPGEAGMPLASEGGDRVPLAAIDVGQVETLPSAEPLAVDFGPIRLSGYELDCGPEAIDCQLTLTWQATRPPDRDYTVLVHVVDAAGTIVAQDDALPGGAFLPTTTWLPGQRVTDRHHLALPSDLPTGEYRLLAGLYDRPKNERLPATGPAGEPLDDTLLLTTLVRGRETP